MVSWHYRRTKGCTLFMNGCKPHADAQIVLWSSVRNQVAINNPTLFKIIEALSPSKALPFIKATYTFGELPVKNGQLMLPKTLPANSSLLSKLTYAKTPLGLLLDNQCEVFLSNDKYAIPLNVLKSGEIYS